jgi:tetratricopeptide (TPR) repeat protein
MVLLRADIIITNYSIEANAFRLKDFEDELLKNEANIGTDEKATAYFNLSLMNMVAGNYRKALKLVNPAIKLSGVVRKDIHRLSLMLELVIHYFLGNTDLLFSKLNSYKRLVDKGELVFSVEKKLPKLLNTLFNSPQVTKNFSKLKEEIELSLKEENKMVYRAFMPLNYLKPI